MSAWDWVAAITYPGLTALCTLWVFILVARQVRWGYFQALLVVIAWLMAVIFGILALGAHAIGHIDYGASLLAARALWAIIAVLGWVATYRYLRRQAGAYRREHNGDGAE